MQVSSLLIYKYKLCLRLFSRMFKHILPEVHLQVNKHKKCGSGYNLCTKNNYMHVLSNLGYCPEYNTMGNVIQEHYSAECTEHDMSCPPFYNSAESYKCKFRKMSFLNNVLEHKNHLNNLFLKKISCLLIDKSVYKDLRKLALCSCVKSVYCLMLVA